MVADSDDENLTELKTQIPSSSKGLKLDASVSSHTMSSQDLHIQSVINDQILTQLATISKRLDKIENPPAKNLQIRQK